MSSPFDIGSLFNSLLPLISLVLVMFILTSLFSSLRGAMG